MAAPRAIHGPFSARCLLRSLHHLLLGLPLLLLLVLLVAIVLVAALLVLTLSLDGFAAIPRLAARARLLRVERLSRM